MGNPTDCLDTVRGSLGRNSVECLHSLDIRCRPVVVAYTAARPPLQESSDNVLMPLGRCPMQCRVPTSIRRINLGPFPQHTINLWEQRSLSRPKRPSVRLVSLARKTPQGPVENNHVISWPEGRLPPVGIPPCPLPPPLRQPPLQPLINAQLDKQHCCCIVRLRTHVRDPYLLSFLMSDSSSFSEL